MTPPAHRTTPIVISDRVQEFQGVRYFRHKNGYFFAAGKTLSREVWAANFGRENLKRDVHHRDGNKANNTPENLETLTRAEHIAEHWTPERSEESRRHIQFALASPNRHAWHRSASGRVAIRKNTRQFWAARRATDGIPFTCEYCGHQGTTLCTKPIRFCSVSCGQKWRRRHPMSAGA